MTLIEGITASGKKKTLLVKDDGELVTGGSTRPSISYSSGTINTIGDNIIVPAPGAGLCIYITHIVVQNESSTPTTVILKDSSPKLRNLGQSQGDGIALVFPETREMELAVNTPLILNLSSANSVGYSIGCYVGLQQ